MGWLTESAAMPQKTKKIKVDSNASLVNLKAKILELKQNRPQKVQLTDSFTSLKDTIKRVKEEKHEEREEFDRDSSSDFDSEEEQGREGEERGFNEEAYARNKLVDFDRKRDVKQHEKKETIIESMQKNILSLKGEQAATSSNYAQTAQHKLVKQSWDRTMTNAEKD